MKRIFALCAIAVGAVCVPAAQAKVVTNETEVLTDAGSFVPCASGGAGEVVSGTLRLHVLLTSTVNGNNVSGTSHYQPQGGSFVGETTGDRYRATGVTKDTFKGSLQNGQFTETSVNNYRIIGPGRGNNWLIHEVTHETINANGDITVFLDHSRVDCK